MKFVSYILIALLIIMLIVPMINASIIYEGDTYFDKDSDKGRQITVLSNGTLCAIWLDDTNFLLFNVSFDSGVTWMPKHFIDKVGRIDMAVVAVDSNDVLHVAYLEFTGSQSGGIDYFYLRYTSYDWSTDTWINLKTIASGNDILDDDGLSIAVDSNDNVYIAWIDDDVGGTSILRYIKYTRAMDSWSAVSSVQTATAMHGCVLAVTDNDYVHVVYDAPGFNLTHMYLNTDTGVWSPCINASAYDEFPSIAANGNTLHVVSTRIEGNIYYTEWTGSSWTASLTLCDNAYIQRYPTISANSDGNLNVFWQGRTWETATDQILSRHYIDGVWGAVTLQTTGSYTKDFPMLLHQNIPSFCQLYDGFSGMYFDLNDNLTYFDSGTLNWYVPDEGGEYGNDTSQWRHMGDWSDYSYSGYSTASYHEISPVIVMSDITVKAFDILVSADQHAYVLAFSSYRLKVNGVDIGSPNCWIPIGNVPYTAYVLRWYGLTHSISGRPLFELFCTETWSAYNKVWEFCGACDNGDVDGDGIEQHRWHNVPSQWDGYYNGAVSNCDLAYTFYYTTQDVDYDLPDFIGVNDGIHETYDNVFITATASSIIYTNYITVYHKTLGQFTNLTDIMDGYTYYSSFVPWIYGDYTVNLLRDGVNVSSFDFTVVNRTESDYYIYTLPNPSEAFESFTVHYKYHHGEGKGAKLIMSTASSFYDESSYIEVWHPTVNTTSSYEINYDGSEETLYFILAVEVSNLTYSPIYSYEHFISGSLYSNYVRVTYPIIYKDIPIHGSTINSQELEWMHNFYGQPVFIKINGDVLKSVSKNQYGGFWFPLGQTGAYNVTLELKTANGTIVLSYDTFEFSVEGEAPLPDDDDEEVFGLPSGYINAMFGSFITLGFLLLPLVLSLKSHHEISGVVYAVFGGIGLGVSTLAGFFPLWLPLMITILMVTILVIEYKKGK